MASALSARMSANHAEDFDGGVIRAVTSYKDFFVHEALIRARSEFFARALNGSWKEAEEKVVRLPDVNSHTFALYLGLVYRNQITTREPVSALALRDIIATYVLCERLQDMKGKGTVSAALAEALDHIDGRTLPMAHTIQKLYEGTVETDPCRNLIVDFYSQRGNLQIFKMCDRDRLPQPFLYDLSLRLMSLRDIQGPITPENSSPDNRREAGFKRRRLGDP